MNASNPQSLARVLAAPWQQRRNAGGLWGYGVGVALCLAAPVALLAWSLGCDDAPQAAALRFVAARSAWVGVFALLVAGWAILVGNVLQQNHPTLARLVPGHVGQLRTALLVSWALASLAAAALPGYGFDAPLAWGCAAAAGLAVFAAALRWPVLWLGGIVSPFLVGELTRRYDADGFGRAVWALWAPHRILWTALAVTGGALVLVAAIGGGGTRHAQAHAARQRMRQVFQASGQAGGAAPGCSRQAWLGRLAASGHPYGWWLDRLLARPASPVATRLLVGLGPAAHWTSRVFQVFWFSVVSTVLCVAVSLSIGGGMLALVLPWLAFGILTGVCTPVLQAVPQLRQTQREQALLALLPGVPRGARLNRWLAWRMSLAFVLEALVALVLAGCLDAIADALLPGASMKATSGMTSGVAAALLPQVAWQWRHWARLPAATGAQRAAPVIAPIALGIAVMALHALTGASYLGAGVVLALAAVAYCAWRWWRMGAEPTAFPVGRLA